MKRRLACLVLLMSLAGWTTTPAVAADTLCDPSFQDCRAPLLELIRNELVGIDVAFWFMEDSRYSYELARARERGVRVRVLVDTRANATNPYNGQILADLEAAGIPMRQKVSNGILHWKMMLFAGQNTVQFSGGNYSEWAFVAASPYQNYVDEVIYFTTDDSIVNTFRTRYDDLWVDTARYANYANISGPLLRQYGNYPKDPELNFPPFESFRSRSVSHYDLENTGIDAIIYRITDRAHTDALIRAMQRGVPVRLLTEPQQYRDPTRYWHSWNVDRLYMAGAQIRHRAHAGLIHQKSTLLRSQGLTVFGSSNWTSPSSDSQEEHNYFTRKANFYQYFSDQFERKWHNLTGYAESTAFVPLPPDTPVNISPANGASGLPEGSVTLTFNGGIWAHNYDIYFGTTSNPPLFAVNQPLGPSAWSSDHKTFTVSGLQTGTTYYWRVVGKTMAEQTAAGPIHSFTTAGAAPPPPPPPPPGDSAEVVLWAMRAAVVRGAWAVVPDAGAAGGARLHVADAGVSKLPPSASPADYFELTFQADQGVPYHLWIRGRADADHYLNDSAHVQFSDSVNADGAAIWRIGTTSSAIYSVQNGNGAPIAGWGWEDHGWAVLGQHVYFASTGTHTIRIQRREDGLSIDQIVLSPALHLETPPGARTNDTTILAEAPGGTSPDPDPDPEPEPGTIDEVVLYASTAGITGPSWRVVADATAAGGSAIENVNAGLSKAVTASASPSEYIELTFQADADKPYRLWVRSRAEGNYWANDSVHVQFSDSVDGAGSPAWRIGTTSSAEVNLEDCSGCGISNWGWQDNGWGVGVLGPVIRFATAGTHTIRIQRREDGIRIDQIVLSAVRFLDTSPGALKNDTVILSR